MKTIFTKVQGTDSKTYVKRTSMVILFVVLALIGTSSTQAAGFKTPVPRY